MTATITHTGTTQPVPSPPIISLGSPERKKINKKENQFILQHQSKLHAYGRDKAPYPFSYDREVSELWCMDRAMMHTLGRSVSYIQFGAGTPKRCLDVGTGLGDWVIDAAKQWHDCTFVGYDLVNIQIPLLALEPAIAQRIQWQHGNILRQKLPFEDDEFDHVHIQGLAYAIPENKWHSVFEEISRVLRPGGTVEIVEEDAIFPVLPRWFTDPLRPPVRRTEQNVDSPHPAPPHLPHDHALLEKLFYDVFRNRFLNPTPSSMLPSYFSAFFSHVVSPPVTYIPVPPIAPLQPLPNELPGTRVSMQEGSQLEEGSDGSSHSIPDGNSVRHSLALDPFVDPPAARAQSPASVPMAISASQSSDDSARSRQSRNSVAQMQEDSTSIGGTSVGPFHISDLSDLDSQCTIMQLHRAMGFVIALKEAMWEELKEIIDNHQEILGDYGWDHDDLDEKRSRPKYNSLIEKFRTDMQARISLWYLLNNNGWELPKRDHLSRAELIEEERLRLAILEARRQATEEDLKMPCRAIRLLVGMKACS